MRAVIQRVESASVVADGVLAGEIGRGLLVLLGVETGDTAAEAEWLAAKVAKLRVFGDDAGQMNLALVDVGERCLVVSQFTLLASTRKGNRPSYVRSARPPEAAPLYEAFVATLSALTGQSVPTGVFGADMRVRLVNDGPVTIVIDSRWRE